MCLLNTENKAAAPAQKNTHPSVAQNGYLSTWLTQCGWPCPKLSRQTPRGCFPHKRKLRAPRLHETPMHCARPEIKQHKTRPREVNVSRSTREAKVAQGRYTTERAQAQTRRANSINSPVLVAHSKRKGGKQIHADDNEEEDDWARTHRQQGLGNPLRSGRRSNAAQSYFDVKI